MAKSGKESLVKRLEHLERLLEVNEIRVNYASEPVTGGPDFVMIRLHWLDVSDEQLSEVLGEDGGTIPI